MIYTCACNKTYKRFHDWCFLYCCQEINSKYTYFYRINDKYLLSFSNNAISGFINLYEYKDYSFYFIKRIQSLDDLDSFESKIDYCRKLAKNFEFL